MSRVRKFGEWRCRLGLCGTLALAAAMGLPLIAPVMAAQHRSPGPKVGGQATPRQNTRNDRPPNAGNGGAQTIPRPNVQTNPNRPGALQQNPQDRWRSMSPADRQRALQNEKRLQSMSPAQQQVLRDRAQVWNRMTPEQRDHVKNDVLPQWRQMPPDRKQAIRNRLRVLQNMPESARNQRLNDPNFTRGMSEEDRSTLRDLSHLHVGAPPE
ncbi:MAG: DUF3106 domain-containing protein [Acidobacteria bacterium]|nr:DUF3106 domain-containing protein [Acidobacteriota bacterium]